MTYREMTNCCQLFNDGAYHFEVSTDVWEDFQDLYESRKDDDSDSNLFKSFKRNYNKLKEALGDSESLSNGKALKAFYLMCSDAHRIHAVLKTILQFDTVYTLYKNHMEEQANNLRKNCNKLLRDLYELDKPQETNETTENTTTGNPS